MPQQQHSAEYQRRRVDLVLAGVFRSAAVSGLEYSSLFADVCSRCHPKSTHQTGTKVADNITVKVRQHNHIIKLRFLNKLHAHIVNDAVLEFNVGIFLCHASADIKPKPVTELHNIGLVNAGYFSPSHLLGILKGKMKNPLGGLNGNRFNTDTGVNANLPLAVFVKPVNQL